MGKAEVLSALQSRIDEISESSALTGSSFPEDRKESGQACNGDAQDEPSSSDSNAAFKKIIDLVNASDKSEAAIRQRLSLKGFDEEAIESSVARAKEYGFIDDKRYADVLVRSRLAQGRGLVGIERELLSQDIDPDLLEGWPYEYGIDESSEIERALDFLQRKPPRSKNVRESAYRKLVSKGYSTSVASSAARLWTDSHNYCSADNR